MQRILAPALLALAAWGAMTEAGRAQAFTNSQLEHALGPGTYVPRDGLPYTQWYSYRTGALFYPGMNPRELIYQDYLDRLDRAQKFGYRIPQDPFTPGSPYYNAGRRGPGFFGLGFGFFQWR
jgi:hypothetical protein